MSVSKNSILISISKELYDRIKPLTNDKGGRNKDKRSFTTEISRAFDALDKSGNDVNPAALFNVPLSGRIRLTKYAGQVIEVILISQDTVCMGEGEGVKNENSL